MQLQPFLDLVLRPVEVTIVTHNEALESVATRCRMSA